MANLPTLPDDVLAALSRGETIEALKRLRTATGLGLQEAKYLLDQHQQEAQSRGFVEERAGGMAVPASVREALAAGNKIEAIRLYRQHFGSSLKDAKDAVEELQHRLEHHLQSPSGGFAEERAASNAIPAAVTNALASGSKIEAIRLYRQHSGAGLKKAKDVIDELERKGGFYNPSLAPGEVSAGSNRWLWMLIAFAALCAFGYYLFFL